MAGANVNVWATGDGVRVNPETGRYLEDRSDIHADYPSGDYKNRNAIWDSGRSSVTLHSARNEFVSFQVIVESDESMSDVSVQFDCLRGPGGTEISGRNIALFKAWYVEVKQPSSGYQEISLGPGWYPDALMPQPAGIPLSFSIPDADNAIGTSQRNQSIWVDIHIPRERLAAPPGAYGGRLVVSWPGGRYEIAVKLQVWDFALPDEIHCKGDIWNDSMRTMAPDLELRYYQMAHRHRFHPGVSRYRPDITVSGMEVSIDWTAYDKRLKKYFDGSAFTEGHGYWGPGYSVPIDHIMLPFDVQRREDYKRAWPVPVPREGPTPEFEAVWQETARQLRVHFDADPTWHKVKKVVFIDALDESYNEAAYKQMTYYCDLLRGGMGKSWFQYRIDGAYSWEVMEALCVHVDLWVCHTIGFDQEKIAHFRKKGVEPWFYGPMVYERKANSACGSNTFLDLDLLTCRGVGWAAWMHKCGFCEWEFDWNADKAWREAVNYRGRDIAFNGSGLLIYRGDVMGSPGPVPSIRLKAHRRGFQDYEYFWLLQQAGRGDEADALVESVLHAVPFGMASVGNTEIWKNNPEAWDHVRIQAGELLSRGSSSPRKSSSPSW